MNSVPASRHPKPPEVERHRREAPVTEQGERADDHPDAERGRGEAEGRGAAAEGVANQEDECDVVHREEDQPEEQRQDDHPGEGVVHRIGEALARFLGDVRTLLRVRPRLRIPRDQRGEECGGGEGGRVHRQGEGRPAGGEQESSDQGPGGDLHVEGGADQRIGAHQLIALDEGRDEGGAGRRVHGGQERGGRGQCDHNPERRKQGDHCVEPDLPQIAPDHQPPQVPAVSEGAGHRPEQPGDRQRHQDRRDRDARALSLLRVQGQGRQRGTRAGVREGQREP